MEINPNKGGLGCVNKYSVHVISFTSEDLKIIQSCNLVIFLGYLASAVMTNQFLTHKIMDIN